MILAIENPEIFVGLSLNDAQAQIAGYGYSIRILAVDERKFLGRSDYDPLRINLKIKDNRVIAATIG